MRSGLLAAMAGMTVLLLGCSGPRFDWVGHWKGRRDLKPESGVSETVLNTVAAVELKLNPNGTFELLEGGTPKEGDWRHDGKAAFLKIRTFMGRPIEEQGELAVKLNQEIELRAQNDGTVHFRDPAGFVEETVTLKRQKSESQPGP